MFDIIVVTNVCFRVVTFDMFIFVAAFNIMVVMGALDEDEIQTAAKL